MVTTKVSTAAAYIWGTMLPELKAVMDCTAVPSPQFTITSPQLLDVWRLNVKSPPAQLYQYGLEEASPSLSNTLGQG